MNIVLIGYRGAGKSVVSRILAKRLEMTHVGMDAEIVRRAKMTIPEIVEKYGWPKFRDMEYDIARDLSGRDNLVVDTGGGVIERPENMLLLGQNARIFWLKASVSTIVSRIQSDAQRPALVEGKTFTEEVEEVLDRRNPNYKSAAHYEFGTDDLTPEEVADKIIAVLRQKK